jgi:hypothetical protein
VIGVDKDGKLVKTPIPTSIVLVTPPTKTDYNDRETIDLSGAVVVAKMADGSTWTDADHPNGHVSCTPEPAVADASAISEETWTDGDGVNAIKITYEHLDTGYWGYPHALFTHTDSGMGPWNASYGGGDGPATLYLTVYNNYVYGVRIEGANEHADRISDLTTPNPWGQSSGWRYTGSWNSSTGSAWKQLPVWGGLTGAIPTSTKEPRGSAGELMPTGGTQTITLNWARPGDGKVLSTTMEINVGAHTTESSSGTEGSGGGGGF